MTFRECDMPDPAHRLAEVPLFAGLPAEAIAALARASLLRRYQGAQILCSEGDPGEALYVVESGRLRVSRFAPNGQEAVLAVVEAPAALGELALLDGAPRDATITAQGPVVVRLVPRTAFLALLRSEPALGEGLLATLAGWVRHANARQAAILGLDVPGRLAQWLLRQAAIGSPARNGAMIDLNRSQGELAAELGTTRSTLNRALAEFARLGLAEIDGERVHLRDVEGLRAFVE
jgi:CRP/FNR family cyclic AMP-dependent transcriptional regulator